MHNIGSSIFRAQEYNILTGMAGEMTTVFNLMSDRFIALKNGGLAMVLCFALASCNSSGPTKVDDTLTITPQENQVSTLPKNDEIQDPRQYCPKTVLRAGTETLNIYPKGVTNETEGSAKLLRFRATISEVARECNKAGSNLNIRVGVRGRYLSGPKGETGSFVMPVRIAVTRGDEVLYSQLHKLDANIPPQKLTGTFSFVDNNISIPVPENQNILIYVGYDEGPYDTK